MTCTYLPGIINSPLTPIFKQASTYLFESGQFRKLFQQWTNINEKSTDVTQSVQMGQVFLILPSLGSLSCSASSSLKQFTFDCTQLH